MKEITHLALAVSICSLATASVTSARAEDPPNLVGIWKGATQAVYVGSNPYRVAERRGPNFSTNQIEFTYSITEQKGSVFAGTSKAGGFSETVIGAIHPDNRSGVMSDDDGQYILSIRDANTIDVCYQHSFPTSRVAACWTLKRSSS